MAIITSFVNINTNNLNDQYELINKLDLSDVLLTTDISIDIDELRTIINKIIKEKRKIHLLDFMTPKFDIANLSNNNYLLEQYELVLQTLSKLPIEYYSIDLPTIANLNNEKDLLMDFIKEFEKLALKYKIKFMIKTSSNNQPPVIAYIFKQKIDKRRFSVMFNPNEIVLSNYPVSTAYRLLKNEISLLVVTDYINEQPVIIGKGKLDYFNLFKRLIRDKYNKIVAVGSEFTKFMSNYQYKKIKAFFSKKERSLNQVYLWSYNQIKSNNINVIINYQMQLLKVIFK